MTKTFLNEELVKQIFFYSDDKRPNAIIADEVDIVQFAEKLEAYLRPRIVFEEHQRCVGIVREMNPAVADALNNQRS